MKLTDQENYGERLTRIEVLVETGLKSVGRSIDLFRKEFEKHLTEDAELSAKLDQIERELDTMRGGYRVFLKMCGVFAAFGVFIWGISAWVARNSG